MTMSDTVSAETSVGVLRHVDPESVAPNPLNPRKTVTVSKEFVESIRAAGVVKPLHVFEAQTRGDGQLGTELVLLDGARRREGAVQAKKAGSNNARTVPVIVLPEPSAADQILHALKTSGHQSDLTPIEEARAFLRLIEEEGLSQQDIVVATGRSKGHVSKRVAIIEKLPPKVLARFDNRELTVEAAFALSHIADDVDLVEKLAGGRMLSEKFVTDAVKDELQKRDWAKAAAKTTADLKAKGADVVDRARVANGTCVVLVGQDPTDVQLTPANTDSIVWMAMTVADHAKAECAAVAVNYRGDVVRVCLSPDSHEGVATLRRSTTQPAPSVGEINEIVAANIERAAERARASIVDDGRPSWLDARDRAVLRRSHIRASGPSVLGAQLVSVYAVAEFLDDVTAPPRDWVWPVLASLIDPDGEADATDVLRDMPSPRAALMMTAALVEYALFPDPAGPDDMERDTWSYETIDPVVVAAYREWLGFVGVGFTDVENHWLAACEAEAETDNH